MSNQLKNETSPYLLQHSENPVNWYPWCKEAFEKAKSEDKPVFLSIGYSTCHWCHVMAHESFENEEIAEILNKHFVSIKVDREERPDIDSVYMSVCQTFTGSGGWPMSIFMTWNKKPFFAGTYFPPKSHYGISGFSDLLKAVSNQWDNNRSKLLDYAEQIVMNLKNAETGNKKSNNKNLAEQAVQSFLNSFDKMNGGFGSAPKFPTPHNLLFLILYAKQNNNLNVMKMAEKTLLQMRKGGIFDHIGYGFSRYSTDKYFFVPHFEKMLYDNALLIMAYSAYSEAKNSIYFDTAEKTAEYIIREMTSGEGGFYSAQDADSEGVEGKFYTFTLNEILEVLGKEKGNQFAEVFDITSDGNFEGVNIPNLLKSSSLNADFGKEIQKLYDYRKKRTELHLDDKILLSWNSLMIAALSMLYRVSKDEKYLQAAKNAQNFIEKNMCNGDCLFACYRNGRHSDNAFLDDYAFYISALIELYNSTLDRYYLEKAEQLCCETVKRFSDNGNGGFYLSESDNTELFMNPKEVYDGAVPSGNSVMLYNFVRLYQLTDNEKYHNLIEKQSEFLSSEASNYPEGYCMFLIAKLIYENPPEHIVIVLKNSSELETIRRKLPFLSNVIITSECREYPSVNNRTTYYVCKNHMCLPPSDECDF